MPGVSPPNSVVRVSGPRGMAEPYAYKLSISWGMDASPKILPVDRAVRPRGLRNKDIRNPVGGGYIPPPGILYGGPNRRFFTGQKFQQWGLPMWCGVADH
jgi:hypothetical protein